MNNPNVVVIGFDVSTKKLAYTVTTNGVDGRSGAIPIPDHLTVPEKCAFAERNTYLVVNAEWNHGDEVHVFVEEPFVHHQNVRGSIPLAQVNGAVLAGASKTGAQTYLANIQKWKQATVGKGNATKAQVAAWVRRSWPTLAATIGKDQDQLDSAAICHYGVMLTAKARRMKTRKFKQIRKTV